MMKYVLDDKEYNIVIERKSGNRNTYIRVKNDLTILVTTNRFTSLKDIERLLRDSEDKLDKMIRAQEVKKENNEGFNFLGNKYDIIYVNQGEVTLGEKKAFVRLKLSISTGIKDEETGYYKERIVTAKAFGQTAEFINSYYKNGDYITLDGKYVDGQDYENNDGELVKAMPELIINNVYGFPKRKDEEETKTSKASTKPSIKPTANKPKLNATPKAKTSLKAPGKIGAPGKKLGLKK